MAAVGRTCWTCHGQGWVSVNPYEGEECIECNGKGVVPPTFCVPSMVNVEGDTYAPQSPKGDGPWRYSHDGAISALAWLEQAFGAKPNCIVRVYMK